MICGERWKTCECAFSSNEPVEGYDDYHSVPVPMLARSETFPMTPTHRNGSRFIPPLTAPPLGRRGASDLELEDEVPVGYSAHSVYEHHDRDLASRFDRIPVTPDRRYRERERDRLRPRDVFGSRDMFEPDYHHGMMEEEEQPLRRHHHHHHPHPHPHHDDHEEEVDEEDDDDGYDYDDDDDYRRPPGAFEESLGLSPRRRRRKGGADDYMRGGTIVPPAPPTVPHGYEPSGVALSHSHGFDRGVAKTADYVSEVNKARGSRSSHFDRRLADRFSPQRANQVPPLQSLHHMPHINHSFPPAPLSPLMGMGPLHGVAHGLPPGAVPPPHMGMMPPPVPQVPQAPPVPAPLMRRHTGDEEAFASMLRGGGRMAGAGRGNGGRHEYGAAPETMTHRRRHSDEGITPRSMMAGLTGLGRGMDRVYEWRNYVEPGSPEVEQATPAPMPPRQRLPF